MQLPSLSSARLVAGQAALDKDVKHVNIIEAPDVAKWISPGTVLLSSYYAFESLSNQRLESVLTELVRAGVVAVILKTHRLVDTAPAVFATLCDTHGIALLLVGESVRYEDVLMDIMLPIINLKASLLDRHYRMGLELARLRMQEPSLKDALASLSSMMCHDLTLMDSHGRAFLSTRNSIEDVKPIESTILSGRNFTGFSYKSQRCAHTDGTFESRTVSTISLDAQTSCDLIVHDTESLDDEALVTLECIMRYIQIDLLNQRNIDNIMYMHKNNLVDELLTNRALSNRNRQGILQTLKLDISDSYQVIQMTIVADDSAPKPLEEDGTPQLAVAQALGRIWRRYAYRITPNRMAAIVNLGEGEPPVTSETLASLIPPDHPHYIAGISLIGTQCDFAQLADQTQQVKNIQRALKRYDKPLSYGDLGVFKLFSQQDGARGFLEFVPQHIACFAQDHPSLFSTLACYLENGRSCHKTAESLFVHPKTINYRIGKIRRERLFDFDDPDEALQLLFAARILKSIL